MNTPSKTTALPGLEILEVTPGILESLLKGATQDVLGWQPSPDRWSIGNILAHLAEAEINAMRVRARRMVEAEVPLLEYYDQNAAFGSSRYAVQDARISLERFRQERQESLRWLRTLPLASAERTGKHQELGVISLGQLLNEWAFHDLGHLRQIAEVFRAKAFWPNLGGFQRYYSINP